MILYRIGKTKFAHDITGTGAKLNGGRWNHEGVPCVYCAGSRALSLLEYSAHVTLDTIPKFLSFTSLDVPDELVHTLKKSKLPQNWNAWPHPKGARDFGTNLLLQNKHAVIRFPSAIIPEEFIYTINPLHIKMKFIKIVDVKGYAYDARLKS
jgi:RES domain-containing protein